MPVSAQKILDPCCGVQTPSSDLAAKICAQFGGEINELQLIYPERFVSVDDAEQGVTQS